MQRTFAAVLIMVAGSLAFRASGSEEIDSVLLKRFEAHEFKGPSGRTLKYRLFKPVTSDSQRRYPLVLFLHGAAGIGDDNQRQFNGGNKIPPLALTSEENQSRFPCFVLAPQCPRFGSWSSVRPAPSDTIRLTLDLIESLQREFSVDSQRLYVIGVSMGGRGVWEAVTRFPQIFAAAVPICAAGDTAEIARAKNVPIWCFHGDADRLVSVSYARDMVAALRKAGGSPRYTEYPGVGHDSYKNAFQERDLLPWLFAQERK